MVPNRDQTEKGLLEVIQQPFETLFLGEPQ
jgi:hypothetical protein